MLRSVVRLNGEFGWWVRDTTSTDCGRAEMPRVANEAIELMLPGSSSAGTLLRTTEASGLPPLPATTVLAP